MRTAQIDFEQIESITIDGKQYPKTVLISEATNTHGCDWIIPDEYGQPTHFGFSELPPSASLWLDCISGFAVEQLFQAGVGEPVGDKPGVYGGKCNTVKIDVQVLENICRKYWDRANAAGERENERMASCHYCGSSDVIGTDFFNAPVCEQCSS